MLTLDKKKELVSNLEESLKKAKAIVFVKFDKLQVADANLLRRTLQEQDVNYKVAKKTLLKRALASQKLQGEIPEIPGQIAIAYSQDLLSGAREIFTFQNKYKDNISIVGGVFDGKYMNASEMMSIATIPSLQVLRGMFVNLINSPIQRLVIGLDQIAKSRG
jgi:large subunit ribosomal protein L10